MSGAVLVTGASGFVGLALVHHLLSEGHEVVGVGLGAPPAGDWPKAARYLDLDIRDSEKIEAAIRAHGVAVIAHGAAVTAGPETERALPEWPVSVNVGGTAALVGAAGRAGVGRVVLASSVAVYGLATPEAGVHDASREPPAPGSLYGVTKLQAEAVAARLAAVHGLTLPILRLGAVWGAFERDTGTREILSAPAQILAAEVAVRLPRAGHGTWLNVRDAAAGLASLIDAPIAGSPVFDLGGPECFSIADYCEALARRRRLDWAIDPTAPTIRYQLPADRAPSDTARLAAVTGFKPKLGLEAGLDDQLAWADAKGAGS